MLLRKEAVMRMKNQPSMWGSQNKGVELTREHDLGYEQQTRAAKEILSQKVKYNVWVSLASQWVNGFLLTQYSCSSCIISFNLPTAAWSRWNYCPYLTSEKTEASRGDVASLGSVLSSTAFSKMRWWGFFHGECSQDNRDLELYPGSATIPPDGKAWRISS